MLWPLPRNTVASVAELAVTLRPEQLTQLRYDAPARLAALGIIPRPYRRQWPYAQQPQAFPDGFVADPPYRY